MKKIGYISSIILLVLLYGAVFHPHAAVQERTKKQSLRFRNLTLEIETTKQNFVELEPVPIILNLSNRTSSVILSHANLELSSHYVDLLIQQNGEELKKIEDVTPESKLKEAEIRPIAPGEQIRAAQLLRYNLNQIFPQPGVYQIQAVFHDLDGSREIRSNFLTVHINYPTGLDRQAFDYINSNGNPSYFFTGMGLIKSQNKQKVLEDFVSNYDESSYGKYASYLLGEMYFAKQDYDKADAQFDKLSKKTDFVFADKASKYVDKIKGKLAEKEKNQ